MTEQQLVLKRRKDVEDFEATLGCLDLFLNSQSVINTVRSVKVISDSRLTTKAKHVDTAVEFVVKNDRLMTANDKINLTAAFILVNQNRQWHHGVKPPAKLRQQRSYTAMNKFVKELSEIVESYWYNKDNGHFGTVSYSFMQDLYDEAVYGCSTNKSSSNDGHIEHVWMRRLAPIITHYVCSAH